MSKAERVADVIVSYRGVDEPSRVGIYTRPVYNNMEEIEVIFGLCKHPPLDLNKYPDSDYVTYMSYSLRDYPAVEFLRNRRGDEGLFFDSGNRVIISWNELFRSFKELDLLTEDEIAEFSELEKE